LERFGAQTGQANVPAVPATDDLPERPEIEAAGSVGAAPEQVFDFLSDLANHWRLVDRFVEVIELSGPAGQEPDSGLVRLRGPLGVHRTVQTRVDEARRPELIVGTAQLGEGTRARVTWTLAPDGTGTHVRLAAEVEQVGVLDRLLLALGGRAWLRRRFRHGLTRLAARYA
jgi:uncharacterized protein YndB with AHSA1/START domain